MADYCAYPVVLTLTLGSTVLDLMSDQQGFRVAELNIRLPEIRDDVNAAADRHGTIDLSRLYGARAVTISGFVVPSPTGSRQKMLHSLAPFLDPSARATLTYQVDDDTGPRTLTVRASDLSVPFTNPKTSEWSVGWKCPDPLAYDATVQTRYAFASTQGGRVYNWTPPRVYPPGGGSSGYGYNYGEFTAYPTVLIYGPASNVAFTWVTYPPGGTGTSYQLSLAPSYVISAGHYVALNSRTRTALIDGDPAQSVYGQLQWSSQGAWPSIPAGGYTSWNLTATNVSNATQAQISWQDPYLL
jgi:hypothetical protein